MKQGFAIPEDGWFHIATPGEWPHKPTGLVQVLDDEAMQSIVEGFAEHARQPNWPGVLIDFDHQSLDEHKPTVAAGWIVELEQRPTGIWARIRWSDLGRESIEGGRYRFISPVWRSSDCARLGEDRIRPLKLMNCAVTNDPNIKGMFPLSNAAGNADSPFSAPAVPIGNSRIRSEDERKAMFARMGGGGGGPPPAAAPAPAAPVAPPPAAPAPDPGGRVAASESTEPWWRTVPDAPVSARARHYQQRIDQLQRQRDRINRNRPAPPEPPLDYAERIDIREAMIAARRRGESPVQARREADAENRRRRQELLALRRGIERQYSSREARERALARELEKRQRDYASALDQWNRANSGIDRQVATLDREIHQTQVRLATENQRQADLNWRQHRDLNRDQERARQQALREQIQSDIHAERQRQWQARQEAEQARPAEPEAVGHDPAVAVRAYRATQTARSVFYEAVRRGDYAYARRIMPEGDIDAARKIIDDFEHATGNLSQTQQRRQWDELSRYPPPTRPE